MYDDLPLMAFAAANATPHDGSFYRPQVPIMKHVRAPSKLDDFGETLHGAAKHLRGRMMAAFRETDPETASFSEVWPDLDYAKLIEEGADARAVALIRAMRDTVPAKPRKGYKVVSWARNVTTLRNLATALLDEDGAYERVVEKLGAEDRSVLNARLYQRLGHARSLKGLLIYTGRSPREERDVAVLTWTRGAHPAIVESVRKAERIHETIDSAMDAFVASFDRLDETNAAKSRRAKLSIYSYRSGPMKGRVFIGLMRGQRTINVEAFDSTEEARAYLKSNEEALYAKLEKLRETPEERRKENRPRSGPTYRIGDIDPETFTSEIPLRGVQFGTYVGNEQRQGDLNRAYDAFHDLKRATGLDMLTLTLGGRLGLAFGARGRGGKNPAAAHYEPGGTVINLTKRAGAGSLAHEVWHGIDNRLAGFYGVKATYLSEAASSQQGNVPTAILLAMDGIRSAILGSGLDKRSSVLDRRRSKDYWSTWCELTARCFEASVIHWLAQDGANNDFLANIQDVDVWNACERMLGHKVEDAPSYPYPLATEIGPIAEAYAGLMEAIRTARCFSK